MATSETQIIQRFFRDLGALRADVVLGVGDDAALLTAPAGMQLAMTTDALVEGVHFRGGAPPRSLGHRALAINLSDLAAMGATPAWALLSLNMPQADEAWVGEFANGFGALAREYGVALVGGNLSRGPLSITVQLVGFVPHGTALRRDGGRPGDDIYVSGTLGDAAAALLLERGELSATPPAQEFLRRRFEYPQPRVLQGLALRGVARACIDISDGLYADLERVLQASGCGAVLEVESLPLSPALREALGEGAWRLALAGGEDYELCCCIAPARALKPAGAAVPYLEGLTRIGTLRSEPGIELRLANAVTQFSHSGFDHFRE
jgi:thiamine-monophosphate kinase